MARGPLAPAPAWRGAGTPGTGEAPPDARSPAYPAWALVHGRAGLMPSLEELSARARAARAAREAEGNGVLVSRCPDQERVLIWARDVRALRSRCRIDLGTLLYRGQSYRLAQAISASAEPEFSKSEMLADFVPKYASRDHAPWHDLDRNIVRDDQHRARGCYWDDEKGIMFAATRLALQLVASGTMPSSVGPDLDRLFSEARGRIRAGDLPIVLSDAAGGADDRGVLAVTRDGRVAGIWHDLGGWYARTVLEINVAYGPTLVSAALADYLLWWAWRLHTDWRRGGDESTYYTGVVCARLAFAELASIGALVLHESVHFQVGPHCQTPADPAGKGSGGSEGLDCLHHSLEMAWIARAASLYNLPAPPTRLFVFSPGNEQVLLRMASGASPDSRHAAVWENIRFIDEKELFDGSRIDVRNEGTMSEFEYAEGMGCADGAFEARVNFAVVGTVARVRFKIPAHCSSGGTKFVVKARV